MQLSPQSGPDTDSPDHMGLLIIYLARERSPSLICVMYMDLMPDAHVAFFKKQVPVVAYVVRYMLQKNIASKL